MVVLVSIPHPDGSEIVLCSGLWLRRDGVVIGPCDAWRYNPIGRDFGPPTLLALCNFVRAIDEERSGGARRLMYCVRVDPRAVSNAAFLLGGYMILALGYTPGRAMRFFARLVMADYVDITGTASGLRVRDCLDGLYRARLRGWVGRPCGRWCGRMNMDKYALYGDMLNGDLHEVVPGRIMALRTPLDDRRGAEFVDIGEVRRFAARYYARIFRRQSVGVAAVFQLPGVGGYDSTAFEVEGIQHVCLRLVDDWPTEAQVAEFVRAVDAAPKVAVVGDISRTGTLVARYLMQRYAFTGREALGWLRIVRPGSVVGAHQQKLLEFQPTTRRHPALIGAAVLALLLVYLSMWCIR